MKRLLERPGHLRGLEHGHRQLREGLGDRGDVDGLEVLLVQLCHRRLAGDAEDRDRIRRGGVEARDHVGAPRPAGADAYADVAGLCAAVAIGHVRGAFVVPGQDVIDPAAGLHRGVERVDRRAG